MKRALLVLSVLSAAACIPLEEAFADCVNSGRCKADDGGATDAGVTDAGPLDAGAVDAGTDAAVPYDGGTRCTSSPNPRLRCDPPLELGTGPGISTSALSSNANGFLAGWAGTTLEIREVHLDGGATSLVTGVAVAKPQLAIDGRGARWAAVWANERATSATCVTDTATSVTTSIDGGEVAMLSVAVSPTGAVAVSAVADDGRMLGASATGCPVDLPFIARRSNGATVVWTTASGGSGFRYVQSVQNNFSNGYLSMYSVEADGGSTDATVPVNQRAPGSITAVASTSGSTVLSVFDALADPAGDELDVFGTSADFSGDGEPRKAASVNAGDVGLGTCGPGCVALGFIPYELSGPATVMFFGDDASMAARGAYDAVCALQPQMNTGATIEVASFGGRLGVLLTSAASAKLYLCDVPP